MFKKRFTRFMPMMDANGGGGAGGAGSGGDPAGTDPNGQQQNQNAGQSGGQPATIDYEKLAEIIAGKQSVAEDKVLRGYFQKQGLSQEEMDSAIAAYKEQRKQNEPDFNAVQQQAQKAQAEALTAKIEAESMKLAEKIGVKLETIPYLLKLADVSAVAENGAINPEKLEEALNKVLEDLPQLKPQQEQQQSGVRQIGAAQNNQNSNTQSTEKAAPTKRWNRWNN